MSDGRKAVVLMLLFAAVWALVEAIAGHVMRSYSAYQVVWTRYAVHLLLMIGLFGWREPRSLISTRRPVFQLARSLLMLCMPAAWIIGREHGAHNGAFMAIFWSTPLLIMAFAAILLRERGTPLQWLAAAAASAGAAILMEPKLPQHAWEIALALVMAVSFSLYVVMTRSLRTETTRANLFYSALGVFLALSVYVPQVWVTPTMQDLAVLTLVGLLGYLTLFALDRATAAAPVSTTAPITAMQVVVSIAIGTLVHGYSAGLTASAALAMICLAAMAVRFSRMGWRHAC